MSATLQFHIKTLARVVVETTVSGRVGHASHPKNVIFFFLLSFLWVWGSVSIVVLVLVITCNSYVYILHIYIYMLRCRWHIPVHGKYNTEHVKKRMLGDYQKNDLEHIENGSK